MFTSTHQITLSSGRYLVYAVCDNAVKEDQRTVCINIAGIGDSISCYSGNEIQWQASDEQLSDADLSYAFGDMQCEHTLAAPDLLRIQECHQDAETYMTHSLSRRIHELKREVRPFACKFKNCNWPPPTSLGITNMYLTGRQASRGHCSCQGHPLNRSS